MTCYFYSKSTSILLKITTQVFQKPETTSKMSSPDSMFFSLGIDREIKEAILRRKYLLISKKMFY